MYRNHWRWKFCLTLEEIESIANESYCKIKYNIDGKSSTYNVHQIWSSVKTISSSYDNNVLSNFYGRNYVNCFKTITSSQKDNLCNTEKK